MDKHSKSNREYTKRWERTANENESRLFIALGVDASTGLQVYPVDEINILDVPKILRECADKIEQGLIPNNGLIIPT